MPARSVQLTAAAGALALLVTLVGVIAFYRWTAESTHIPRSFSATQSTDRFNQLVDGFDAGRLDLPIAVPPGLAALPDPADPVANAPYRQAGLQDLSVYRGRAYLYWGPVPALVVFWPSRALGIGRVPQVHAVTLFCALAFLSAAALLLALTARLAPSTPRWMRLVGVLALGGTAVWPWLIRRPDVYEVAIASATAFLFAGLWLYVVAIVGRVAARPVPLALGSLCLGLAAGSRASFVFAGALPLAWVAWRARGAPRRQVAKDAALALGPLASCALALLAYNHARFGSPLDFGISHLLLSPDNAGLNSRPGNIPAGVWFYLFGELHLVGQFPYVVIDRATHAPFALPSTWLVRERAGGLLPTAPIALAALAALHLRGRAGMRPLALAIGALSGLGAVFLLFDAFYVNGAIERYEADFVGLFVLAGLLGWYGLRASASGLVRLYVGVAGAALACFGAVAGALASLSGPDATLPFGWESLAPRLDVLTPPASTFAFSSLGRQAWLGAVVLCGCGAVIACAGWAFRSTALPGRRDARTRGRAGVAFGLAIALVALLVDHSIQNYVGLGMWRTAMLSAGLAVALVGASLATLARDAASPAA
jgi:hypothetical protein